MQEPSQTSVIGLLYKWQMRRLSYMEQIHTDYGDESPERNKIAWAMEFQLMNCVAELAALCSETDAEKIAKILSSDS